MKVVLNIFLFLFSTRLAAQKYDVSTIPDSLIKNAGVVNRYEEVILEIKSPGKYVSHEHHVYTILNESADDYAIYRSFYDKFTTIDYLSGVLYNEKGKELKRAKKKEMQDLSSTDGSSLMQDTRYIRNAFYCSSYPYTVDYEEDDTNDGVLSFPGWLPVKSTRMSVEDSKYIIIAPKDYEVRYKQLNFTTPPVVTEKAGKKTYTWELKNFPAQRIEVLAPFRNGTAPYMIVAPSDFEAAGYKGNMSSWENFGRFIYQLNKGRDVLPTAIKKNVHALTDNLKDPRQKISALYDFLQKNTHYISIQLGIGGLQPFDATSVATNNYGDCKALSNYMVSLLKEAGIIAKYVVIKASENARQIVTDFPDITQFNHVICCVPLSKDTVWLECTSQTLPAGYLSGFTADRWGLLVDENGGKLVRTPKYGLKDNVQTRNINATINTEGNLNATIETRYKAMQQDDLEGIINAWSNDKVLEYLKNGIDLPTYDILNFHYTQHKDVIPSINESVELTATNYAQVSGKRLFINPNILTRSNEKLSADEDRKYDLELDDEHRDTDTVGINIPPGYIVESAFHDTKIESKFGTYGATVKVIPGKIMYVRNQEHYRGRFPAKDYAALVSFYEQVYKADHAKIVFAKAE